MPPPNTVGMVDFAGALNNGHFVLSLHQYFGSFLMRRDSKPSLLYRYFFFSWLFRNVDCGSWLERSAAWRHNQSQAHWLLTYLKRWLVLDLLALSVGALSSQLFQGHWICIPFFVLFSVAIPISSVIVVAWLGLRLLPGPDR